MGTAARQHPANAADRAIQPRTIGRYTLFEEIASGGMGSVHYGRFVGPAGFARTVAIKKLHPHLANEEDFVAMLADEARLASRIRHPNVVSTIDVVESEDGLFVVMDYVHGESLSRLLRASVALNRNPPPGVIVAIMAGALRGLHAAHEARDESGRPLEIIHRDVSPQNILVGVDGQARVFDFGVAKAAGRLTTTREGLLKGKLAYMAPEQIQRDEVDRRCDVYAASVVLWEGLAGTRLFDGLSEGALVHRILHGPLMGPSRAARLEKNRALDKTIDQGSMDILDQLDAVVLRGLARDPDERYGTARDMAIALESATKAASVEAVEEWVATMAGPVLARRADVLHRIESQHETTSGISVAAPEGASADSLKSGAALALNGPSAPRPDPPRRRSGRALSGAVVFAILLAAVYFAWYRPSVRVAETTPLSAPASVPAPSASAASTPSATATATVDPLPADPPSSATTVAPPLTGTHPGNTGSPSATAPIVRTRPAPAMRGCRTVSYFDADGVKHFKQECP
jgi:serine/threonine protein kinase